MIKHVLTSILAVALSFASVNTYAREHTVVLMGDSIMYGMQDHIEKDIWELNPSMRVVKLGKISSGLIPSKFMNYETVSDKVKKRFPNAIGIFCFGINDVGKPMNGKPFMHKDWKISYYMKLVTLRGKFSKCVFVLPPLTTNEKFNRNLKLVREFIRTTFIDDRDTLVLDFDQKYMKLHEPDGIHIKYAGCRMMSKYITGKIDF